MLPRVSNRQLVGVVHAAEQVSHNDLLTMRTLMMNMKTLEVLKTLKLLLLTGKMTLSMTMSRIWTSSSSLS